MRRLNREGVSLLRFDYRRLDDNMLACARNAVIPDLYRSETLFSFLIKNCQCRV